VPTELIPVDPDRPTSEVIERAASVILAGRVVAIPTDALYALVADPFNLQAVARVFRAKRRDLNRALPLLVPGLATVEVLAAALPESFYRLARRFWPGPVTIVVPASARVPLKVTGNTGRLAVRQPASTIAVRLLERLGQPLIATSANISGHPTCRSGLDVFAVMDGKIELVLDGGLCTGEGATTVDLTGPRWRVIREGAVPVADILECLESESDSRYAPPADAEPGDGQQAPGV